MSIRTVRVFLYFIYTLIVIFFNNFVTWFDKCQFSIMCNNSIQNSKYCGPYTLSDVTSHKKFVQDYAHAISIYSEGFEYPKEIRQTPRLEMLLEFAEKEFRKQFSKLPTYAVYAPACVTICGENTDSTDGKVLSMATQLVTVIVGTRRANSKQCKVKTLSREIVEDNYNEFFINSSGLDTSGEHTWVNHIKAVIRSFSVPKEHIPGFKALIISSVPIKMGLGSSSALMVATYTFLEAMTNVYTPNTLEKSIACQQAEKILMEVPCSIGDTLTSVVGVKNQVMEFDSRTLQIQAHDWNAYDVDLILINSTRHVIDSLVYQKNMNQCRELAFALNFPSPKNATIPKATIFRQLFSSALMKRANHIMSETDRVNRSVQLIKQSRWKQLGMVMWESHCSIRDNFGSSCLQIEDIMGAIQNISGVYGARLIGRGYCGFVLVMVQRQAMKELVKALSSVVKCQEYQVITPSSGARILYMDKNDQPLQIESGTGNPNTASRYHLPYGNYESYEIHRGSIYGVRCEKAKTPLKAMFMKNR